MKKFIGIFVIIALMFTSVTMVSADSKQKGDNGYRYTVQKETKKENKKETKKEKQKEKKEKKQTFKINGSPLIKYGRYKLPIAPVTKGMEAKVDYDKNNAVLTVEKGDIKIVVDFKNETVTINGVEDDCADLFKVKNSKKTVVLIKYIASALGIRADVDDDEVEIIIPNLNAPKNIRITTLGGTIRENTINSTTVNMTVIADITAGQAAGGKAELYVGSKLVAVDTEIYSTDTFVNFNIGTTTNEGLKAVIPSGGTVSIKLYNAGGEHVTSGKGNPKLLVDYEKPVLAGVTAAVYNAEKGYLTINAAYATQKGDKVDVTKITLYDASLQRFHILTDLAETGSKGEVNDSNQLVIKLGSYDKIALKDFQGTDVTLILTVGTLLTDAAGNTFELTSAVQAIPVTVTNTVDIGLYPPTNVKVTPLGGTVLANTLNCTTTNMTAMAGILAGQATGGKAELYVGTKLIATDTTIFPTDTFVNFNLETTSNDALKMIVPEGGAVTVKLYDATGRSVVSKENLKLTVDYVAPTITGVTSAVYVAKERKLHIIVSGASDIGDSVDVTKLILFDGSLAKSVILSGDKNTGSNGSVASANLLIVNVGWEDHNKLKDFGGTDVYLNIPAGSLLYDDAGNVSATFTATQSIPVIVLR